MTVGAGCPLPVAPVCDLVSGAGTGVAKDVLSAVVSWIVAGASWLLDQLGGVMSSSTSVHLGASWFQQHYAAMSAIAAVVAVPMLFLAAIQAVYRQSPAALLRAVFVHLPLAGFLTVVAAQLVQLSLTVTDVLCTMVTRGDGNDVQDTLKAVATVLVTSGSSVPGFVLGIGALLVVIGALALWIELIVRSAAVYVAVLFLPLALASLVWPSVSHWCRRLVETLASLVLSKFVVVSVLSLAVGAVANGEGFGTLLTAGALLLLAAFMPFSLLRLVPMIEAGAALQLEGARQRLRQTYSAMPRSAASFAMNQAMGHVVNRARTAGLSMGVPGTGTDVDPGVPGTDGGLPGSGGGDGGSGGSPGGSGGTGAGGGGGVGALGSGAGGVGASGAGAGGVGGAGGSLGGAEGGSMEEMTDTRRRGMWPMGRMPADAVPKPLRIPPGDIPIWPGNVEITNAMMDAVENMRPPDPPIPDSVGGMPGAPAPMDGPGVPASRFPEGLDAYRAPPGEGPWGGYPPGRAAEWPRQPGWVSTEPPIETPEDAAMWDRAVRRDTKGDDEW